jgi:hypothetical protein
VCLRLPSGCHSRGTVLCNGSCALGMGSLYLDCHLTLTLPHLGGVLLLLPCVQLPA